MVQPTLSLTTINQWKHGTSATKFHLKEQKYITKTPKYARAKSKELSVDFFDHI